METGYLQHRLKGRGSRRKLNDVLLRKAGCVVRLYLDSDRVKFRGVTEEVGEIHLCRQLGRRAEHQLHL